MALPEDGLSHPARPTDTQIDTWSHSKSLQDIATSKGEPTASWTAREQRVFLMASFQDEDSGYVQQVHNTTRTPKKKLLYCIERVY